jgi:hypothetical protein
MGCDGVSLGEGFSDVSEDRSAFIFAVVMCIDFSSHTQNTLPASFDLVYGSSSELLYKNNV